MFRKQFLLTNEIDIKLDWQKVRVGSMNLFYHSDLELTHTKSEKKEIVLLGSLYDWENPRFSNHQIAKELLNADTIEALLISVSKYCGQFVLIFRIEDELIMFNDACAQSELYYTTDFTCFGTQPKLMSKVSTLTPHHDKKAKEFYNSELFKKKCLFVGNSTHKGNLRHLLPNYYIDIAKAKVCRFFPKVQKKEFPVNEVTERAVTMLKGYLKAISNRHEIVLGVTAGYDSRVLFLASLEEKCKYFVFKYQGMSETHYDITIPQKLAELFEKDFEVIEYKKDTDDQTRKEFIGSVDFPLFWKTSKEKDPNRVFVNGNVSEVARNYYGYHKNLTAKDLVFLNGYQKEVFPYLIYDEWLKTNRKSFEELGYNYLDMFYWEEKMGNWLAKAITESNAMGRSVVSPFNSRDLLNLLLSTKRKLRDSHFNKLYDAIFFKLSQDKTELKKIPFNPTFKQQIIKILKYMRVYNFYRYVGIKTRFLS